MNNFRSFMQLGTRVSTFQRNLLPQSAKYRTRTRFFWNIGTYLLEHTASHAAVPHTVVRTLWKILRPKTNGTTTPTEQSNVHLQNSVMSVQGCLSSQSLPPPWNLISSWTRMGHRQNLTCGQNPTRHSVILMTCRLTADTECTDPSCECPMNHSPPPTTQLPT